MFQVINFLCVILCLFTDPTIREGGSSPSFRSFFLFDIFEKHVVFAFMENVVRQSGATVRLKGGICRTLSDMCGSGDKKEPHHLVPRVARE